ncbi:MAG: hypothetical protein A3G41_02295 [Elusimicrobia bacterium RIFCSPLOWO2_12_FULL_59_9]|nr:MAG: hypothetical protein A3G41_02295 [Elusimicrobia bacterium RIFCSPLOWO2_12_FULL_59_9]
MLSVVIITRNEERDLPGCLDSVRAVADEIVLVDNQSTDKTLDIARQFSCKVYSRRFDHYAGQKQYAVEQARGEWVLSLDADERLSPPLREEIRRALSNGASAPGGNHGYYIPFEVHFLGRKLRFGGVGGENHLRLFRREAGRFTGGRLHEGVDVAGKTAHLSFPILHTPYRDLNEYFDKFNLYTSLAAQKRWEQGMRFRFYHHILLPWEFFRRAVLQLGFLDGIAGISWAGLAAFHTWVKYIKLKELEKKWNG